MEFLFYNSTPYYRYRRMLLFMRLTTILLLVGVLHAGAKGFSQTVTLSVANMPLDKVCIEIEKQTGYYFVYAKNLNEKSHLINVEIKRASVENALHQVFEGLPYIYQVIGKVVVVNTVNRIKNDSGVVGSLGGLSEIKGRVTNAQGEPLVNATVMCKKNTRGTQTNANGEFWLKGLSPDDKITITYIGYKPQSIKIGDRTSLTIILDVTDNELDKAVVQAYGTTSQRLTTGNIGKVTAEDIEKQPVMNPLMALQGRVAGLAISPTSGYASGPIKVEIRGRNSIDNGFVTDPLYIIDGVPLTVLDASGTANTGLGSSFSHGFDQTGMSPAGGQSPLYSLNPADIESIEVLKDADATAIYGSRGANGVILITTKKGKAGIMKFDINVYQGESAVTNHWKMLNTPQYLEMRREAFANDAPFGVTLDLGSAPDLLAWDTTRYTDWQKYLWGNIGKTSDVEAGLSGGNAQTVFRIGAGYHRETDISTFSGASQRGSVSFNLSHHNTNQRFGILFTTNYSFAEVNMIQIPGAATLPPDAPAVFTPKGNLNYVQWDAENNGNYSAFFPFAGLLQPYSGKTNFLTSNLTFNYQIIKGLNIKASIGYNNTQTSQTSFQPIASQDPSSSPTGSAIFGNIRNNNWIMEPQVEYNRFINRGKLNVLVGATAQATTTDGLSVIGNGYTNDALLRSISNAPIVYSNDNYGQYKYSAMFGRITYNWENKYILNLNARRDGSSRFGPGKQFGNFGSVGAAWIISEEKWLKASLPTLVSFVKFRGSYGITGSDAVGDYRYLSQWSVNNLQTYDGISPLVPIIQPNPNFQWQVNKKLEGALDLGFLKDQFNLEIAYYRNRCNNQLLLFPTPEFTGFPNVTANSPANVQNSGWEFLLNAKVINKKNFAWSINFNIAINRNELLSYPNLAQSPYANTLKVGQSLEMQYLLHYTGVDPQTGTYTFQDKNHDGKITYDNHIADDTYTVNLSPKFNGGFGNQLTYKNWQLGFFFNFVKQIGINALSGQEPGTLQNQPLSVLSRWQKPGDVTNVALFSTNPGIPMGNFSSRSDGVYTDASYIRLSNLSFSYSMSEHISKKLGMKVFRLFLQGQNLFIITKYKGIDPDTQNFGGMPPAKIITGGLSCSF